MPPEVVDNPGGSPGTSGETTTPQSTASVHSGTASEALLRAASSVAESDTTKPLPAGKAGDTPVGGDGKAPVTTTAAATVQPPKADPATSPVATGDAPEARITAATRNARTQILTTIGGHLGLTDAHGQARGLAEADIPDLRTGLGLLADLRNNPQEFLNSLARELKIEIPKAATEDYTLPKPSVRSEDGTEVYTAGEVAKIVETMERKLSAKLEGQMRPIQEAHAKTAEERQSEAEMRQNRIAASQILTDLRARPHFKEHEAKIAERLKAMDPGIKARLGAVGALYQAYNDVLASDVFPTITTTAEQRVRQDNARQAAGSAIVVPGAGGPGSGKKPEIKGTDQLAAHMRKLEADMAAQG